MKHFLQYSLVTLSLTLSLTTHAAITNNNAPNPKNLVEKQQAANTQNATNSLILWLNSNLVNGTPLDFAKSMKGNWQNILSNEGVNNLNWQLTRAVTFVALKGVAPATEKNTNNANATTQQNNDSDIGNEIAQLNTANQANLVPKSIDGAGFIAKKLPQFNIGKLLSTNTIAPLSEDNKNAQILMQFLSGLANSVGPLSAQQLQNNSGPIDDFQQLYGTYVAQQSLGLNVLYSMISERLVRK
ncbi:MAG: hypothetical protein K2Q14_07820, partial [Gammaproteobacteria bacterium]|nr:hypothetical protein [Gammaproteobacteria bacterium]MBY0545436.1 hypothetical protein [Gammaproteobacteria bacterium]